MIWLFAVLVVLAMGAVALVAAGRGAPMVDEYDDRPDILVPATGPLGAADLRRVRFSLSLRGYRMSEVDALLDRIAAEMEAGRSGPSLQPPSLIKPDQPDQPAGPEGFALPG